MSLRIDRYLQGEAPVIKSPPPADETLASRHEKIIARIADIKQKWNESVGEIEAIIESSGIDLMVSGRLRSSPTVGMGGVFVVNSPPRGKLWPLSATLRIKRRTSPG